MKVILNGVEMDAIYDLISKISELDTTYGPLGPNSISDSNDIEENQSYIEFKLAGREREMAHFLSEAYALARKAHRLLNMKEED